MSREKKLTDQERRMLHKLDAAYRRLRFRQRESEMAPRDYATGLEIDFRKAVSDIKAISQTEKDLAERDREE